MHPLEQIEQVLGESVLVKRNPQLFENNPVAGEQSELVSRPDCFSNTRPPNLGIQEEKFQHRMVILLKAKGLSNNDIAAQVGMTYPWVSQILRQPWAKTALLEMLKVGGADIIGERLRAESMECIERVVELRDSASAPAAVKLAAANTLLDRFLGKAVQKTENTNTNKNMNFADIEEVQARIKRLEEAEKALDINQRAAKN